MAVLKSTSPQPGLTPFSIRDMELQAQALLLRAKRAADVLLTEAQREADLLREQARTQGFDEGKTAGHAKGLIDGKAAGHQAALAELKPQLSSAFTALTAAMAQLDAARVQLETDGLFEVIQLALAVAARVTKRQALLDPQVLIENLRQAMQLAVQAADVRIVINPNQRQLLQQELPRLQLEWPNLKHVEVVDDPQITEGGCRLLTRHGEVDARIDAQLDRVIDEVMPGAQTSSN